MVSPSQIWRPCGESRIGSKGQVWTGKWLKNHGAWYTCSTMFYKKSLQEMGISENRVRTPKLQFHWGKWIKIRQNPSKTNGFWVVFLSFSLDCGSFPWFYYVLCYHCCTQIAAPMAKKNEKMTGPSWLLHLPSPVLVRSPPGVLSSGSGWRELDWSLP